MQTGKTLQDRPVKQSFKSISTIPVEKPGGYEGNTTTSTLGDRTNDKCEECDKACWEIVKAATLVMLQPPAPARKPTAWIHAPSQPLMQSLLSQFQTPTVPRRISRFFRVWLLFRLPCRADHPAYFGLASFISPILSAVDVSKTKQLLHRCQRNSQRENEISVNAIVENRTGSAFRYQAKSIRLELLVFKSRISPARSGLG